MTDSPFVVCLRTYNRPASVGRLLGDLARECQGEHVSVTVYDDASTESMRRPRAVASAARFHWERLAERHGKKRAHGLWNKMLADCRLREASQLFVFLDDDMRLCRGFFARLRALWEGIGDRRKASLTLMCDDSRERSPCWTAVEPVRMGPVTRTGWLDMAFLLDRSALDTLRWACPKVPASRWARDPLLSSGVGAALSRRLHAAGRTMYRVHESLVVHAIGPSHMNPAERRRHSLLALRFVDGEAEHRRLAVPGTVQASLATIPSRAASLELVVASLRPQVDKLNVYLNGHASTPLPTAGGGRVEAAGTPLGGRDLGDAGKFFWSASEHDYHFVCDDDLRYPPDYVTQMCAAVERYAGRAVVGLHGVVLRDRLGPTYGSCRAEVYHFSQSLGEDRPVHVLGTGCSAYARGAMKLAPEDFPQPNMADVWFALACQRQSVPRIAIARPAGWVGKLRTEGSIWESRKADPALARALALGSPWKLLEPPEVSAR